MTCSMDGCPDDVHCKGLCKRHYQQQWRTGDATIARPNPHGTPEERFWRHVTKGAESECWEWTGQRDKDGYGTLHVGSTIVRSHRFSYELHAGATELLVRHRCNNPPCVNPAHLRPGTHDDNMADRMDAGNYEYATCRRGHPWTESSTAWQGPTRNHRTCKICRRMTPAERKAFDCQDAS